MALKNGSQSIQWTTPNQDKIHLSKNKIDVIQARTTHLGKVTLGIDEGKRPDYKAMEKALASSFVHSYDAAVLKSSFQDWHQPIALIHDCLKVLPNDTDKAKERIKHGFVQVCKGDPLARLADERKYHKSNYQGSRRTLETSQPCLVRLRICLIRSYSH